MARAVDVVIVPVELDRVEERSGRIVIIVEFAGGRGGEDEVITGAGCDIADPIGGGRPVRVRAAAIPNETHHREAANLLVACNLADERGDARLQIDGKETRTRSLTQRSKCGPVAGNIEAVEAIECDAQRPDGGEDSGGRHLHVEWEVPASIANSVVVVAVPKLFEYAEPTISGLPGFRVPWTVTVPSLGLISKLSLTVSVTRMRSLVGLKSNPNPWDPAVTVNGAPTCVNVPVVKLRAPMRAVVPAMPRPKS